MVCLILVIHTERSEDLNVIVYFYYFKMIAFDNNDYALEKKVEAIKKDTYTMNSYLTALTQISSLTYLTSLSTLTAYANDITSLRADTYNLNDKFSNYLLSSETSSLTFDSSVLSLSNYVKTSDTSAFTSPWDTISTSTLNAYLKSSETSSLTFDSSVLSLSEYLLISETSSLTFNSSVLSLSDYLLISDASTLSFDTSVLNSYLLSSKTTDFAGTTISTLSTLSTLSSLTSLTSLSNTPYMIDAEITNPNLYLYNVSRMTFFNDGTIMGDFTMGDLEQNEINSNWMNSYDHLLSFKSMSNCKFSFATSDSVSHYASTDRRIGFTANTFYNNTLTHFDSLSGKNFSNNKLSYMTHMTGDYAFSNSFDYATEVKLYHDYTNTYNYVDDLSVYSGNKCKYTGIKNYDGMFAESCTFSDCINVNLYCKANRCSFTGSIHKLCINSASSCSGYANNCTIYKAEKNYLTARSFTIGSASSCTFQTCDSINFNALYNPQLWAPHYLKGGIISGGSVTGDNLVMDVGYIDGLYMGNVCRGTISFTTMGNPFTIASAGYPQDIVISCNLHPYQWSTNTMYFYLSADLRSSFTLHVYNIENIRPSFQSTYISQYLCLDVLGPRGVFSYGSYSYASLAQYCPTSRLSYNGVPWAAILH